MQRESLERDDVQLRISSFASQFFFSLFLNLLYNSPFFGFFTLNELLHVARELVTERD